MFLKLLSLKQFSRTELIAWNRSSRLTSNAHMTQLHMRLSGVFPLIVLFVEMPTPSTINASGICSSIYLLRPIAHDRRRLIKYVYVLTSLFWWLFYIYHLLWEMGLLYSMAGSFWIREERGDSERWEILIPCSINKYKQWQHTQGGYCVLLLWLINVFKTIMYKMRFESVSEIKHTNNI